MTIVADKYSRKLLSFLVAVLLALGLGWFWFSRMVATPERFELFPTLDLYTYFYPMIDYAARQARDGHLFLWNPHQLAGMPGLATWQIGALYPVHVVYLLIPTATAMAVMALAHTILAGVGMFLFARVTGASMLAAWTAGMYFAITAVLPWFTWPPGMEAMAWFPMGLYCLHRFIERCSLPRAAAYATCITMPILAGGYQTTVFMLAAYAWYLAVATAPLFRHSRRSALAVILATGSATCLGVLWAAPQAFPTLELLGLAARGLNKLNSAQISLGTGMAPASELIATALSPATEVWRLIYHVGAIPSLLVVAALSRRSPQVIFAAPLIVYGWLSLIGPEWFLDLRSQIPVISSLRLPVREFFLAQFGTAILIASTIGSGDVAGTGTSTGRSSLLIVAGGAAAILALSHGGQTYLLCLAVVALIVIARSAQRDARVSMHVASVVLAGLVVFDVAGSAVNSFQTPYLGDAAKPFFQDRRVHERAKELAGTGRAVVQGSPMDRGKSPKSAQMFGYDSPIDYDPLGLAAPHACFTQAFPEAVAEVTAIWGYYGGLPTPEKEPLFALLPPAKRCLDLLSLEILGNAAVAEVDPRFRRHWALATAENFGPPTAFGPMRLYRNRNALPRAYAVHQAECFDDEATMWKRILDPGFAPRRTVVLTDEARCEGSSRDEPLVAADVKVVHHTPTEVVLETRLRTRIRCSDRQLLPRMESNGERCSRINPEGQRHGSCGEGSSRKRRSRFPLCSRNVLCRGRRCGDLAGGNVVGRLGINTTT